MILVGRLLLQLQVLVRHSDAVVRIQFLMITQLSLLLVNNKLNLRTRINVLRLQSQNQISTTTVLLT